MMRAAGVLIALCLAQPSLGAQSAAPLPQPLDKLCYAPQAVAGVQSFCAGEVQILTPTGRISKKPPLYAIFKLVPALDANGKPVDPPKSQAVILFTTKSRASLIEYLRIVAGIGAEERAVRPELCSKPAP